MDAPMAGVGVGHLEVDSSTDGDSAYGESERPSSLASIASEVNRSVFENGRRYHGYGSAQYAFPNDEAELERLDMQHAMMTLLLNNRLFWSPLRPDIQRVLDIGTGTGIWAIDFADLYPSAEVIGTDLSMIQPDWVPPNLRFDIDDAELEWTFAPDSFDFIHNRNFVCSIRNWPRLVEQAFKHVKPGGYVEWQEKVPIFNSDDGTLTRDDPIMQWGDAFCEAAARFGTPCDSPQRLKGWMETAGFIDVEEHILKLPIGIWPRDKRLKNIGLFEMVNMQEGLEALSMMPFTRALNWSPERVQLFLVDVRRQTRDRSVHGYYYFAKSLELTDGTCKPNVKRQRRYSCPQASASEEMDSGSNPVTPRHNRKYSGVQSPKKSRDLCSPYHGDVAEVLPRTGFTGTSGSSTSSHQLPRRAAPKDSVPVRDKKRRGRPKMNLSPQMQTPEAVTRLVKWRDKAVFEVQSALQMLGEYGTENEMDLVHLTVEDLRRLEHGLKRMRNLLENIAANIEPFDSKLAAKFLAYKTVTISNTAGLSELGKTRTMLQRVSKDLRKVRMYTSPRETGASIRAPQHEPKKATITPSLAPLSDADDFPESTHDDAGSSTADGPALHPKIWCLGSEPPTTSKTARFTQSAGPSNGNIHCLSDRPNEIGTIHAATHYTLHNASSHGSSRESGQASKERVVGLQAPASSNSSMSSRRVKEGKGRADKDVEKTGPDQTRSSVNFSRPFNTPSEANSPLVGFGHALFLDPYIRLIVGHSIHIMDYSKPMATQKIPVNRACVTVGELRKRAHTQLNIHKKQRFKLSFQGVALKDDKAELRDVCPLSQGILQGWDPLYITVDVERRRDCIVCGDELSPSRFSHRPITSSCSHECNTCRKCVRQWIKSSLNANGPDKLTCTECPSVLRHADVKAHASSRQFDRYDSFLTRSVITADPDFHWCISPTCTSGHSHISTSSTTTNPIFTCPSCYLRQCITHKVPWHTGETCESYTHRLTNTARWKQEEKASEQKIKDTTKPCPKCKACIEKNEGCDHMTCRS
ncbi:S-adenosyl-L-methionine-dependent methyltransferase [Venturia nashicola]|nr:S-adenosyl-L-methionine-dependent methyltransferase [Venturia nashicola]